MNRSILNWLLCTVMATAVSLCLMLSPGRAQNADHQPDAKTRQDQQLNDSKPVSEEPKAENKEPRDQPPSDQQKSDNERKQSDLPPAGLQKPTANSETPIDSTAAGAPLIVAGEEVIRITVKLGGYSPELRVAAIQKRLAELESDPEFHARVDQITTQDNGYSTDITAGDLTLLTVTSLDSKAAGTGSRQQLAKYCAVRLQHVLKRYIEEHSFKTRLISFGMVALLTVVLLGALSLTGWLFPRCYKIVSSWKGKHIRELKIQKARLLSQETLTDVIIGILRIVRGLTVLILLTLYVPIVLSFFPETRELSDHMVSYIVGPIITVIWPAFLTYLPNVVFVLVISVAAYYVITFTHFLFREIERGSITIDGFDPEWSESTYKIVRFLLIIFAFVLIFPYLPGSGSPAFQQVSLFIGVLFSLGSTGAVTHVIAGVFLTYTGAFKIGDRVKIADTVGDVVEKKLLATRIRTIKNEFITIPNALVLGSHIINYSSSAGGNSGLILHTNVTIGYDTPWKQVEQILLDAALVTEHVLNSPAPFVLQTSLDDFYVTYQINAYTDKPHVMAVTYSQLHQNIQDKFNEAGVEIMSPQYTGLRDGNQTTIPESYLEPSYRAPRIGIDVKSDKRSPSDKTEAKK